VHYAVARAPGRAVGFRLHRLGRRGTGGARASVHSAGRITLLTLAVVFTETFIESRYLDQREQVESLTRYKTRQS